MKSPFPISAAAAHRAPSGRREEGIVLVLALLVMLILVVVVTQLIYSATVDQTRSENQALELQMEKIAEAALMKANAELLQDMEDSQMQAEEQAEGGVDPTGGPEAMLAASESGHDSLDEEWARGTISFDLGSEQDFETKIFIEDEDSKINLLLLGSPDEEYQQEWRDRTIRAIDYLRDGQTNDFSISDAESIVERFESWMKGDRNDDELPIAPLSEGPWETANQDSFHPPLSLQELTLTGGLDEAALYGFTEGEEDDRVWVPGLSKILTVWSNLKYETDGQGQGNQNNGQGGSGTGSGPADPSSGGDSSADSGSSGTSDSAGTASDEEGAIPQPAPGVNNGRININTAHTSVLRALFSEDEIPATSWEDYEFLRDEVLEELAEEEESYFGSDDEDDEDDQDRFDDVPREDDPNTPEDESLDTEYPLESVEALRLMEPFSETGSYLEDETWNLLKSILSVQSHVFTVTVVVATREPPFRYFVARSVVWRRMGNDGPTMIPVVPFEKLPPAAIDLSRFEAELEELGGFSDF